MTRDEAVIQATRDRARTGVPQVVSMDADGDWSCWPVTAWTPSTFRATGDTR